MNAINPALQRFGKVTVKLSVELGRAELPLKDILALDEGSLVSLNRMTDELLDVTANGRVVARGEVVAQDGKFALRIVTLADADPDDSVSSGLVSSGVASPSAAPVAPPVDMPAELDAESPADMPQDGPEDTPSPEAAVPDSPPEAAAEPPAEAAAEEEIDPLEAALAELPEGDEGAADAPPPEGNSPDEPPADAG